MRSVLMKLRSLDREQARSHRLLDRRGLPVNPPECG